MNFTGIEVAARRLLQNFSTLPISVEAICSRFGIQLYFTNLEKYNAYYMTRGRQRIIVVNDKLIKSRQRFSIAHEFGHAYLNHGPLAFNSDELTLRPRRQEAQANCFAAELLMPKPHLASYGYLTPKQIAEICDVSLHAAAIRAEQLGWRQREYGRGGTVTF